MNSTNKKFDDLLNNLIKLLKCHGHKILLGFSGGPDSSLCLLLLLSLKKKYNWDFGIIIINHKKNIENFYQEELYIKNLTKYYNIPLFIRRLTEDKNDFIINQNFFRQYRLETMITTAYENQYDAIITGHNLQDQVDTFFMRIGKGTSLYGCGSIQSVQENYGIKFIRPLINTSRETIEDLMKNYGYFLDGTRHWNFQRNSLRKIHKSMENCGINLHNVHLTIEKFNYYISHLPSCKIHKGYNYYYIYDFPTNESSAYHSLQKAIKHINPGLSLDIRDIKKIINNDSITHCNCWFIKKNKDLLVTSQPIPQNINTIIHLQDQEIHLYRKKIFIKNNTKHMIKIMTMKDWCKIYDHNIEKIHHLHKESISSMMVIENGNQWIMDKSLQLNHDLKLLDYFIKYEDFNRFFIRVD